MARTFNCSNKDTSKCAIIGQHSTDNSEQDTLEITEVEVLSKPRSVSSKSILRLIKRSEKHLKQSEVKPEIYTENNTAFQDIDINDDGTEQVPENPSFIGKSPHMAYLRLLKTAILFLAFFGLGISSAMYGPSLFDLAYHTDSSIHVMSYVFTSRSIGYLVGSVVGGWLYDRFDSYLVLGSACMGGALFMIVFPLVGSIYGLVAIGCLMNMGNGALDTDGNALIFVLWPKSGPYMQFLHFTFAVGAFVAPLLVKPFLLPEAITNPTSLSAIPQPNASILYPSNATATNATSYSYDIVPVTWAYIIGSIPLGVSGVAFLAFAFIKTCKEPYMKKTERLVAASGQSGTVYRVVILALFFLLLLQYVGMETVYGGLVFTFAVQAKPSMTKDNAALLTAAYWGSFALARLASVPISKYLKPSQMIMGNLIGTLLAAGILVSQSAEGCGAASAARLWAGTVVLGISASSVFPAALSWAECFLDVSGRTASVLLVGACLGDMVVPVAVGNTLDSVGPCSLMHCVLGLSILCVVNCIAISLFAYCYKSFGIASGFGFHSRSKSEVMVPPKSQVQSDNDMLELLKN